MKLIRSIFPYSKAIAGAQNILLNFTSIHFSIFSNTKYIPIQAKITLKGVKGGENVKRLIIMLLLIFLTMTSVHAENTTETFSDLQKLIDNAPEKSTLNHPNLLGWGGSMFPVISQTLACPMLFIIITTFKFV